MGEVLVIHGAMLTKRSLRVLIDSFLDQDIDDSFDFSIPRPLPNTHCQIWELPPPLGTQVQTRSLAQMHAHPHRGKRKTALVCKAFTLPLDAPPLVNTAVKLKAPAKSQIREINHFLKQIDWMPREDTRTCCAARTELTNICPALAKTKNAKRSTPNALDIICAYLVRRPHRPRYGTFLQLCAAQNSIIDPSPHVTSRQTT